MSCANPAETEAPRGNAKCRLPWPPALAAILAFLLTRAAEAADTRPHYDFGAAEIYSQDVFRIGENSIDDYITSLGLDCGLKVTTARSDTEFAYAPTYFSYYEFTELNHLDHRYRGVWNFRPGPRSTFALHQGVSVNSRQAGFTDLDGAGSEAGQPVLGRGARNRQTRRTAWELEPDWSRAQTARTTIALRGLFRSESYNREELIDSDQAGLEGSVSVAVGRGQTVGGRLRGDHYQYSGGAAIQAAAYDQFFSAVVTWSKTATERVTLSADAGAFRASGEGLDAGLGPTADFSGAWNWRRSSLALGVGLGYSSGGGLSSATRSERGDFTYNVAWGQGFEASVTGTHIMRDPVQTGGGETLQGRSFALTLQKNWKPGWGLGAGVSGLRQQQEKGRSLSYGEATVGLVFRPPVRPERRPEPAL